MSEEYQSPPPPPSKGHQKSILLSRFCLTICLVFKLLLQMLLALKLERGCVEEKKKFFCCKMKHDKT